jgi:hypothetical protein
MLGALGFAVAAVLLAANQPPAADAPSAPAPNSAIIGGHHIQPRPSASSGSPADAPLGGADEVEQLYRELMQETAPDVGRGSKPPVPSR